MEKKVIASQTLYQIQPSEKSLTNYVQRVSLKAEVSVDFVEFVAKCHGMQIRANIEASSKRLTAEIDFVCANYGARNEVGTELGKECVRFIVEKFGFLAVGEVRRAYQMWASDEIKIEGAEMYGGSFNVRQMGKVLAAYNDVRKKVLGNYLSLAQAEAEAEREVQRAEILQQKFEAEFPALVVRAKEVFTGWREVPEFWYSAIKKRWGIKFKEGEAHQIFEDAQELARIELKADEAESIGGGLKARLEARDRAKNFNETAKTIARKLSVFRKVIQNPDFKIS